MKKILAVFLVLMCLVLTGCEKVGKEFKDNYENLNGQKTSYGTEYRTVNIDENNKIVFSTPKEVLNMINNGETFYLYVGDKMCPWCRSVIEKAIEVSLNKGVDKIYYLNIWDDEHNEILRDKYEVKDGELVKTVPGAEEYKDFLVKFDNLLKDYKVTVDEKEYDTLEKRIYAPNFFYIEKGEAVRMVTGISSLQTQSNQELTKEILEDEEKIFNEFFK